jgi:hypothetical protein
MKESPEYFELMKVAKRINRAAHNNFKVKKNPPTKRAILRAQRNELKAQTKAQDCIEFHNYKETQILTPYLKANRERFPEIFEY